MKEETLLSLDRKRYGNGRMPLWQFCWRKSQIESCGFIRKIYQILAKVLKRIDGIEISDQAEIGPGVYFGHPFAISINPRVKLGRNINIHKGVTIGQENRGPRKGVPTIGDDVWMGINCAIVGNITVGNDVLIAPGSFVNKDIPSHSVVVGNPCQIHHKDQATEGYINCRI